MRKQIIPPGVQGTSSADDQGWLDVESLAQVELTSENAAHPIESALILNSGSGWRAQQPGEQTIRLLFDNPLRISRIHLVFQEDERDRTQEFVLRWSPDPGGPGREIVRQQYNFSPPDVTCEREDYVVELDGLRMLELVITPDISGGETRASLARLGLA